MHVPPLACACLLLPSLAWAGELEQGVDALDQKDYDRAITCFTHPPRKTQRTPSPSPTGAWPTPPWRLRAGPRRLFRGPPSRPAARPGLRHLPRPVYAGKQEYGLAIADFTRAIQLEPAAAGLSITGATPTPTGGSSTRPPADFTAVIRLDPKRRRR